MVPSVENQLILSDKDRSIVVGRSFVIVEMRNNTIRRGCKVILHVGTNN